MPNRQEIVDHARTFIGTKWVHQGRTRHGIDCAGLIIVVGKDLNMIDYDTTDYQRRPDTSKFVHYFVEGGGKKKPVAAAQPGDVLVMREYAFPCHTTIVSEKYGQPHIIHAHFPRKSVIEEPLIGAWLDKRVACFEYPGVEN